MLLSYFVVDTDQQLRRVERETVEEIWRGNLSTTCLDHAVGERLRIVSVLCDEEELQPQMCFFVRASLKNGHVTDKSRFEAYEAMTVHQKRAEESPTANGQFEGWPCDWELQLAVALDVPAIQLRKVGVGGPLLMADLWGFSIDKILEYFDEASEERGADF